MPFAVFSDIHSNWEALQEALDYLSKEKIDGYQTLGDSVGYGASPNECFGWVVENAIALMGNHEQAVIDTDLLKWFSPEAKTAAEWTTDVLKPVLRDKISNLQYLHLSSNATLAHGSPDKPEKYRYLFSFNDARSSFGAFKTPLCFVGHTHVPSLFTESNRTAKYLLPGIYPLRREEHCILNPGSVGQPRDRDPRLSLGIFDDETWTFQLVRLKYDNKKAADKIRAAGLPAYLADRLL